MNRENLGCPKLLKEHGLARNIACKSCRLEIERCSCGKPIIFVSEPYPERCPIKTVFKTEHADEYDVCDKCNEHVCYDCQDNAKVGWGVFDALCTGCGKGMKVAEYKAKGY